MLKSITLTLLAAVIFSSCLKDKGSAEMTYFEAQAIYGDIDEIRNQPVNLQVGNQIYSDITNIVDPGKIYVGEDFILIGEEEKGIHVINNADFSNPHQTNFINIPGNREFFVSGTNLFAESYYDVVKYDLTNINNVVEISRAQNVFSEEIKNDNGETLLGFTFNKVTKKIEPGTNIHNEILGGEIVHFDFARNIIPRSSVPASFSGNSSGSSGTINRISNANGHVYVVSRFNLIAIDESSMSLVSNQAQLANEMETVFPYKDKLFIGTRTSMEIFNLDNPSQPMHDYRFNHENSCDPVLPKNGAAYITLRTGDFAACSGNVNALQVLDISNINSPKDVYEVSLESPYGMAVIDNKLYIGEGENGLSVFNIDNPLQPTDHFKMDIKAYDILKHPTRTNQLLIAGEDGLTQYTFSEENTFQINSKINY
jgi:hypothetical protein